MPDSHSVLPEGETVTFTIDITPSWLALLPAMLEVIRADSEEGHHAVKEIEVQFKHMAGAADALVAWHRNLPELRFMLEEAVKALEEPGGGYEAVEIINRVISRL